jgi:hypothetical protein
MWKAPCPWGSAALRGLDGTDEGDDRPDPNNEMVPGYEANLDPRRSAGTERRVRRGKHTSGIAEHEHRTLQRRRIQTPPFAIICPISRPARPSSASSTLDEAAAKR